MKLKNLVITFWLTALTTLACVPSASKADAENWPPTFRIAGDPHGYVNPAYQMLVSAPGRYYAIYGRWPSSWNEIRSCGLVQAPLYAPSMQIVDPDAKTWNFNGDMRYVPQQGNMPPKILAYFTGSHGSGVQKMVTETVPPSTWPAFVQSLPEDAKRVWEPALSDQGRLVLFEMIVLLRETIRMYKQVHGELPPNFGAILDSKMAPIDRDSVNPLTGQPFVGDGRPNDLLYERRGQSRYRLVTVAPDGSTPWWGSYL